LPISEPMRMWIAQALATGEPPYLG